MINDAMSAGVLGIQTGIKRVESSAQELASSAIAAPVTTTQAPVGGAVSDRPVSQSNAAEAMINQTQGVYQVEAGARVVEAADNAMGSLVDIKA